MATPSDSEGPSKRPTCIAPPSSTPVQPPAPVTATTAMSPTPRTAQPYPYKKVESPSPPPRCPSPVKASISNGPMGPPAPRPARPSATSMPPPPPRQPTQDAGARKRTREGSPPLPGQGSPLPPYRRSISPPPRAGQGSPHGSPMSIRRSSSPPLPGAGSPLRRPRSSSPPFENIIIIPQRQSSPVKVPRRSASPPLPGQGQGASAFKRPRSASPSDAGFWHPGMPFAGRPPMGPPMRKSDAPAGGRDAPAGERDAECSAFQRSGSSSSEDNVQGRRAHDTDATSGVHLLARGQSSSGSGSDENIGSRNSSAEMADSSSSDRRRQGGNRASSEASKGSSPGGRRADAVGGGRAGAMLPPPPRQPKRISLPPSVVGDAAAGRGEGSVSGESQVAHDSSDLALAAAASSSTGGGVTEVAQDQLSTARPARSDQDEAPVDSSSLKQASDASSIIGATATAPAVSDASSVGRLRAPSPGSVSSAVTALNKRGQVLAAGQSGGRAMREEGDPPSASTSKSAQAQGFKEPGAKKAKEAVGQRESRVEGPVESAESGAAGALERVASNVVAETRGGQAETVPVFARQNSSNKASIHGAQGSRRIVPPAASTKGFQVPQQRPPSGRKAQMLATAVHGEKEGNPVVEPGGSAGADVVCETGPSQAAVASKDSAVENNLGSGTDGASVPSNPMANSDQRDIPSPQNAPPPVSHLDAATAKTLEPALRALFPAAVYKDPALPMIPHKPESARGTKAAPGTKGASGHPPYEVPSWSAAPGHPYKLEVLKEGAVVTHLDVSQKGAYMFGRSDRTDFALEHATVSRYHAVLQYKEGGEAAVFDLGSTHGTFVNKKQVKPRVYVPLRVGDLLKFGQSTRLYVFQGPTELMPEEGLSRTEKRQLKQLEAIQESRMAEESLVRARTEKLTEVTWGQMDDAEEEEEQEDVESITWETHSGVLTSNQEKSKEKVVKRREKIANLRKEIEAIRGKEIAQGALSTGQQAQIARNEERVEQLSDELESMEETLNESIRESVGAKTGRTAGHRKRGRAGSDEEEDDSDDDEFYNRADSNKKKKKKAGAGPTASVASAPVETAQSLLEKRDVLLGEREALQGEIRLEEKRESGALPGMSGGDEDALDEFMSSVSTQMEQDKGKQLRRQLELLDAEAAHIARLLRIADPMGEAQARWVPKQELPPGTTRRVFHEPTPMTSTAGPSSGVGERGREGEEIVAAPKESKPRALLQTPKVALGSGGGKGPSMAPPPAGRETDAETVEGLESGKAGGATSQDGSSAGEAQTRESGRPEGEAHADGGSRLVASKEDEARVGAAGAEAHKARERVGQSSSEGIAAVGERGAKVGPRGPRRVGPQMGPAEQRPVVVPGDGQRPVDVPGDVPEQAEEPLWEPPQGQTGDGRTLLNDKLGY